MLRDFVQGRAAVKVASAPVTSYPDGEEGPSAAARAEVSSAQQAHAITRHASSPTFRTLALVSFFGQRNDIPGADDPSSSGQNRSMAVPSTHQPSSGAGSAEAAAAVDIHGFLALFYCRLSARPITIEKDLQPLFQSLAVRGVTENRELCIFWCFLLMTNQS